VAGAEAVVRLAVAGGVVLEEVPAP
jgi:hypothetical protein